MFPEDTEAELIQLCLCFPPDKSIRAVIPNH